MNPYADTSFLAALLLVNDRHHVAAVATLDGLPTMPRLPLTPFALLELRNVFARLEWRGFMHRAESEAFMRELAADVAAGFFTAPDIPVADWLAASLEIVREITPHTGTRTLDAVHIALARLLGCRLFLSFDANQRRAAARAGFALLPARLPAD